MDLTAFAAEVGSVDPVTIVGAGTRGGRADGGRSDDVRVDGVRVVRAPTGIEWVQADEMIVSCGAGTPVAELATALADHGQRVALPAGGTVGGALAVGISDVRRLGDGPVRNTLLQARYVSAAGEVVKAGGPTVKNVTGFDVCRLLVGSRGTLGFLGDVILRTRPIPQASQWFEVITDDPFTIFAALHRPTSVLWDGTTVFALLEGHPLDLDEQAASTGLVATQGPPALPAGRRSVAPGAIGTLTGTFVAEVGVGVVHSAPDTRPATGPDAEHVAADASTPDPVIVALTARIKHEFDPTGRLNPGVDVLRRVG